MTYVNLAAAALLSVVGMSALAQAPPGIDPATGARPGHEPGVGESMPRSDKASNILPGNGRAHIASTLPASGLGENAMPAEYLRAARASLVAGRTGQAQQSLEMAQTRTLNPTVLQGQEKAPDDSAKVGQIREALQALGGGDKPQAIRIIDSILAN